MLLAQYDAECICCGKKEKIFKANFFVRHQLVEYTFYRCQACHQWGILDLGKLLRAIKKIDKEEKSTGNSRKRAAKDLMEAVGKRRYLRKVTSKRKKK